MSERVVIVTGFGPFQEHLVNASWEAVKLLPDRIGELRIVKEEIPVVYDEVDRRVPELWETHKPFLVIHVGVSRYADKLTLETLANKKGYVKRDSDGNTHCTGEVCEDGEDVLRTEVDVDVICKNLNEKSDVKGCVSTDAGRFLCEYTFYKSLSIDRSRVLFVHVPPLDKPYSAEQLCQGLITVINNVLNTYI